jgi:hypothetical protein
MKHRLVLFCVAAWLFAQVVAAQEPPPPPGEPEGEGGEEKPPDVKTVKLSTRNDKVTLTDGTVLEGSIVATGSRAVVIVTAQGERTVPRAKVAHIERIRQRVETLTVRTFETMVEDGHEYIVVPPGLEEVEETGPPGLVPPPAEGTKVEKKKLRLRYKPKQGESMRADVEIRRKTVEDLPAKPRAAREERLRLVVDAPVTKVTADGMWTIDARYAVEGSLRDAENVTEEQAKRAEGLRLVRALSPRGTWQPGADRISKNDAAARRLARTINYLTLPVPPGEILFGQAATFHEVIPAELAAELLPPPEPVAVPNWKVTGKYVVKGTGEVAGTNCALIDLELTGAGSGAGTYAGVRAELDVKATARWDVAFGVAEGRIIRADVETVITTTGKAGAKVVLSAKTDRKVAVAAAAPKRPAARVEPAEPAKEPELDKALDDLMKQLEDPDFFK